MHKLQKLQKNIEINRSMINYLGNIEDYNMMSDEIYESHGDLPVVRITTEDIIFPSYDKIIKLAEEGLFKNKVKEYIKVLDGFYSTLRNSNNLTIPERFKAANFSGFIKNDGEGKQNYKIEKIRDIKVLIKNIRDTFEIDVNKFSASLFIPLKTYSHLDDKLDIKISSLNSYPSARFVMKDVFEDTQSDNTLNSEYVTNVSSLLVDINSLLIFVDSDYKLLNLKEIARGNAFAATGLDNLKDAYFLVNVTIAQETLLSGDVLIPICYDLLYKGLGHGLYLDDEMLQNIVNTIYENEYLRYNFANYFVYKQLIESGTNKSTYSMALNSPTTRMLHKTLNTSDNLAEVFEKNSTLGIKYLDIIESENTLNESSKWAISMKTEGGNTVKMPLPNYNELVNKTLLYPTGLRELLNVKEILLKEIQNIEFLKNIDSSSKEDAVELIINSYLSLQN